MYMTIIVKFIGMYIRTICPLVYYFVERSFLIVVFFLFAFFVFCFVFKHFQDVNCHQFALGIELLVD